MPIRTAPQLSLPSIRIQAEEGLLRAGLPACSRVA